MPIYLVSTLTSLVGCSFVIFQFLVWFRLWQHRFAICALGTGVTVVLPLTSDVRGTLAAIERLQVRTTSPV